MAATDSFFDKLLSFYRKKEPKRDEPVLLTRTAVLLSIAYTVIYVLPFYLSAATRPSPQLSRDATSVIRARMRAVTVSSIVAILITTYIARDKANLSTAGTLKILGWWPIDVIEIGRSLLLIAILFAGPLFESAVVEGRWRSWFTGRAMKETFANTIGWRNYVAGPVTEETTFRSALLPLHLFTHAPPAILILTTPLYFGFAHLHHLYEARLTYPTSPLLPAVLRTCLQFTYTTLFGWYAAFLFLRTGSLPAAVLAHAFANWMGLPRFWGRLEGPAVAMGGPDEEDAHDRQQERGKEDIEMSPRVARSSKLLSPNTADNRARSTGRSDPTTDGRAKSRSRTRMNGNGNANGNGNGDDAERGSAGPSHAQARARAHAVVTGRLGVGWTVGYYLVLVAGVVGFRMMLWRLTESGDALVEFGERGGRGRGMAGMEVVEGARRRWGW